MMEISCRCGTLLSHGEEELNAPTPCPSCGAATTYVCGESLPAGSGAGDFDRALLVVAGPSRLGEQFALGGVAEIPLGKMTDRLIQLLGHKVSRHHATLCRVDFGPGRWEIRDNHSTNGLFVNGERVESQTLEVGDKVAIGEFMLELRDASPVAVAAGGGDEGGVAEVLEPEPFDAFDIVEEAPVKLPPSRPAVPAALPAAKPAAGAKKRCPSCKVENPATAKRCTGCGTNLALDYRKAGAKDETDENQIEIVAQSILQPLSFLLRLGIIPVGFGKVRGGPATAAWVIVGLTSLVGALFALSTQSLFKFEGVSPAVANLMLWSGVDAPKTPAAAAKAPPPAAQARLAKMAPQPKAVAKPIAKPAVDENGDEVATTDENGDAIDEAALAEELHNKAVAIEEWNQEVGFRPHQLVTHAFVAGLPGWLGFSFFLVPQMAFLCLFGLPANKLLGHWRFVASYLALVVATGLAYHLAIGGGPKWPTGGPGGAIMGLAGMYLVLCPKETVYMAAWFRLGLLSGVRFVVFKLPGLVMFALWIAVADVAPTVLSSKLSGKVMGPMLICHLIGLFGGVGIASLWLLTKQAHANGRDLISALAGANAEKYVRQA